MDIRNIKTDPERVSEDQLLFRIFEYNKEQLDLYKGIEDLPDWPLDVNNPKAQFTLKHFIGNISEELIEGIESLRKLRSLLVEVGWNTSLFNTRQAKTASNYLQNANEEQADALGFYLTVFSFSNIGPEDILSYQEVETFLDVFTHGVRMQLERHPSFVGLRYYFTHQFHLGEICGPVSPGFRSLSNDLIDSFEVMIFEVLYQLGISRNLLKSRIWKQTPVMTKELEYQEALVKSFYLYLGALAFVGFTPYPYYDLFYRKQQLNLFRIRTNY